MSKPFLLTALLAAVILSAQTQPIRSWADADKQAADLNNHPDDTTGRANLLRYYFSQIGQSSDRVKPLRRPHILWFVENHPDHPILSDSAGVIEKTDDPDGFAQAEAEWKKAIAVEKPLADTFANAIVFYRTNDPDRAREIAEEGLQRYPGHVRIANRKGTLLAYSIAGIKSLDQYGRAAVFDEKLASGPQAERDRKTLESSDDPNLLAGAAYALNQQVYPLHAKGTEDRLKKVEDLTVRLFRRAMEVDPNNPSWRSGLMNAYQNFANYAPAPSEKISLDEKALAVASTPAERSYVLTALARLYLTGGHTAKATDAANELVNSDVDRSNWNYGNMIFTGNTVLGELALKKSDVKAAAQYLLAAGRAPTTPQLGSFGPQDWQLAQDLLSRGDRETVLAYLELVRGFWKNNNGRIDNFVATIRNGATPNFTGPPGFEKSRYIGRPAPDFRLADLKGAEVALSEFRGKVVIVDFWATWCGPCRNEMPDFQKVHRELAGKDVVVLALDVNEPKDVVAEYIAKEKFTFPVLLANGADVMDHYGVHAYPTTFFVDTKGLVADVAVGSGPDSYSRIQSLIAKARAGAPPPGPEPPPTVTPTRTAPPRAPVPAPPSSTSAADFYRDAVRQHNAKDYEGAIKSIERAIELRPDWTLAVVNRADTLYHARRYDESIAGWTHAIELDPKRAASYDGRGLAYSNSGRHDKAIPDYDRAIEINPEFAAAYNNRGWACMELGRLDQAQTDLNKAIELNPSYTTALFNRAHLFVNRRDFASAVADFNAILHINPGDTQAANQKAAALRQVSDAAPAAGSLAAPKLLSPAAGEILEHYPRDTTVVWSEVPGASAYMVEWDYRDDHGWASERTGAAASLRTGVPVASFKFVGAQSGRWRVWALDAAGAAGPASEWREFRYTR